MGGVVFGPDQGPRARQAMTVAALMRRIALAAGPTAARWSTYPGDAAITPDLIFQARREAHAGYPLRWFDLCQEVIELNSHLRSVFHQRRAWIFPIPYRTDPPENFKQDPLAQALAAWLGAALVHLRAVWDDFVYNLLSASAYGYSAAEMFWGYRGVSYTDQNGLTVETPGALVPVFAEPVAQKHFKFQLDTDEPLLWLGEGSAGQRWPHGKFIFHKTLGDLITERRGFMTGGVWMHLATQQGWAFLLTYAKLYGLPQLAAFVDKAVLDQPEERSEVDELCTYWGQGLIPVFSDDVDVKQVGAVGGSSDTVHQNVIDLAERELSKLVVGATLINDQGDHAGSYAQSGTHATTSHIYVLPDGSSLSRTLERDLHSAIIERNLTLLCRRFNAWPEQIRARIPWGGWKSVSREQSAKDWIEIFTAAKAIGFPLSQDQISKVLGISPGLGADQLQLPSPNPAPTANGVTPPSAEHLHGFRAQFDRSDDPGVMICLYPPREVAQHIALPGSELAEDLHVTLAYLGRAGELGERGLTRVRTALETLFRDRVASPLSGVIGGIGRFAASETSDGLDPFYASVDVPGLTFLQSEILQVLSDFGVEVSTSHGFTPHITLAYIDPAAPSPLARLAAIPVEFTEVWLTVGSQRRPFALGASE